MKKSTVDEVEGLRMGVPGPVGPDGTVFKRANLGWGTFNGEDKMGKMTGLAPLVL